MKKLSKRVERLLRATPQPKMSTEHALLMAEGFLTADNLGALPLIRRGDPLGALSALRTALGCVVRACENVTCSR